VLGTQYRESYNKYDKIEPLTSCITNTTWVSAVLSGRTCCNSPCTVYLAQDSMIYLPGNQQLPGIAGGCFTGFQVGISYCLLLGTQYRVNYNKYDQIEQVLSCRTCCNSPCTVHLAQDSKLYLPGNQ
jgi:hypothetical protein